MSSEVNIFVEKDRGGLHYTQPQSHNMWEGKVMISPTTGSTWAKAGETKVYSGKEYNYNKSGHALATSHWDTVARPQIIDKFERATQAFIGRGY